MIEQERRGIHERYREILRSEHARGRRHRVFVQRALQSAQLLVDRAHVVDDRSLLFGYGVSIILLFTIPVDAEIIHSPELGVCIC